MKVIALWFTIPKLIRFIVVISGIILLGYVCTP